MKKTEVFFSFILLSFTLVVIMVVIIFAIDMGSNISFTFESKNHETLNTTIHNIPITSEGFTQTETKPFFKTLEQVHPAYLEGITQINLINKQKYKLNGIRELGGYWPVSKQIDIYSNVSNSTICHEIAHHILNDTTELQHSLIHELGETEFCFKEPAHLRYDIN